MISLINFETICNVDALHSMTLPKLRAFLPSSKTKRENKSKVSFAIVEKFISTDYNKYYNIMFTFTISYKAISKQIAVGRCYGNHLINYIDITKYLRNKQ